MSTGETVAHLRLKALAIRWALEAGFAITAAEVRVPRSGFRVDVAAYARGATQQPARTAVFECKQARADLLKDSRAENATREQLAISSSSGTRSPPVFFLPGKHRQTAAK